MNTRIPALETAPQAPVWGAVSNAETAFQHGNTFYVDVLGRVSRDDYDQWLDHISAAAACTRPIRLQGDIYDVGQNGSTTTVFGYGSTATMPDCVIYKACGNRRESVCPACAKTYQRDAYHLLRAGLIGGKGVPATVSLHPAVFATFTAPSFGTVHTRAVKKHSCAKRSRCDCRPEPCHARHNLPACAHGRNAFCFARHEPGDSRLGKPLCADCYDYDAHVVWNRYAGELWRRTKQAVDRRLAKFARQRGIPKVVVAYGESAETVERPAVRACCGKAAEYQVRGVVHFHVLFRLDGVKPLDPAAVVPPPHGFTDQDLETAIRQAAAEVAYDTPAHVDQPEGWHIVWGKQLDIRPITLTGDGEVTDSMVAGYLAKYATKSTEVTGHHSTRITHDNINQYADISGSHTQRLIAACWRLGRNPHTPEPKPGKGTQPIPGVVDPYTCEGCGRLTVIERCQTCNAADAHPGQQPTDTDSDEQGRMPTPSDPAYYRGLQRRAHMLGFAGHFLTKSRRYTGTFRAERERRITFRREETILIINTLSFAGIGWHTSADAALANASAARAREHRQLAREEIEHQIWQARTGSTT